MKGFNFHFIFHAIGLCLVILSIVILTLVFFNLGIAFLKYLNFSPILYLAKKLGVFVLFACGVVGFVLGVYLMYMSRKVFSREER